MLPRIIDAYFKEGFAFEMGSPARLATGVTPIEQWRPLWSHESLSHRQVGISLRDAWFIQLATGCLGPTPSLVIGNSHGISTLLIAELLQPEPLDAIDAETSHGSDDGTELTRRVAARLGLDVQVTTGFSPRDLDRACRNSGYGFILIDGEHTNQQLVLDFRGIVDRAAQRCVIYCHDVGLRDMDRGWLEVRELAKTHGFRAFDLSATDFGSTLLVRGVPDLERMLELTCPGLRSHSSPYHAGLEVAMPANMPDGDRLVLTPGERVCFYGAGNDLIHQGHFMLSHPDRVVAVYDDQPSVIGSTRYGADVLDGQQLVDAEVDAVVISTHAHAEQVREQIARMRPDLRIYPRPGLIAPVQVYCVPE